MAAETTTTTAPSDGMNECTLNENTLVGEWGYYVGDWAGATARYLGGTTLNDFILKVTSSNNAAWGVQAFTKNIAVNAGSKYTVSVTLNSDTAGASVLFKENVSDTSFETKTLAAGDNVFTGTYTPTGSEAAFYFDLGAVAAGTTVKVTSFSLTEEAVETTAAETTEAETTTPETVVTDWQEVYNSNGIFDFRNATNIEVVNVQQPGFATEQGIYMSTSEAIGSIKINDEAAGEDAVAIQGAGAVLYLTAFSEGTSSVSFYSTTGAFLGSVEIRRNAEEVTTTEAPTEAPTEEPTEAPTEEPTEEPTTEAINRIEDGIEINGYQVSAKVEGMRTVYSVDSEIDGKAVVSSGLIYSLSDLVDESEMYIGSTNAYVRSYASTAAGLSDTLFSDSDIATSYAMTMRFGAKTASEYNAGWRVRAYAELEDGTYVYSKSYTYKIYDIADTLYQNKKMNTKEHHEYLYNDILKVVNKDYAVIDYDWSNAVVGA